MQSAIFHLIGKPGVRKHTIGSELSRRTGARLVDNHSINNVLFNLVNQDGITPLPATIWPRVSEVRAAVLDTPFSLRISVGAGRRKNPARASAANCWRRTSSTSWTLSGWRRRHKRFANPTLWMFGTYRARLRGTAAEGGPADWRPSGNPFADQFPRYFPDLRVRHVDAGHFFPEEAPTVTNAVPTDFLAGRI